MDKRHRHQAIRHIIQSRKISNQQELAEILEKEGIVVTQATLSRDLAQMNVGKIPDTEKGHIYILPEQLSRHNPDITPSKFPGNSFHSLGFSGNLAVIKCTPSFAPSIALIIDDLDMPQILGTIAGDDTVLVILKESISHQEFQAALCARFPELKSRI